MSILTQKPKIYSWHRLMFLSQYHLSAREIGCRLGRHHSSIARELRRNVHICGNYRDDFAHRMAEFGAGRRPRHFRKRSNRPLRDYVLARLREDWSPATIVGRLNIDFPRSRKMRLSVEMIYRDAAEGGLLHRHLLHHVTKRGNRREEVFSLMLAMWPHTKISNLRHWTDQ